MPPGSPLRHFRDAPLSTRLHTSLRWRLFPFRELLAHTPARGAALDVGCGHGLWPLVLGEARPELRVTGLDPDAAKIAHGVRAARHAGLSNVDLAVGAAEDAPAGVFDAVSVIDVLYLLPAAVQERVLEQAAAALAPGGLLLVKETSDRPRWKHAWTRAQEIVSVRLLRVTLGATFCYRSEADWLALLRRLGLRTTVVRLDAGRIHPHVLFVATRPTR